MASYIGMSAIVKEIHTQLIDGWVPDRVRTLIGICNFPFLLYDIEGPSTREYSAEKAPKIDHINFTKLAFKKDGIQRDTVSRC